MRVRVGVRVRAGVGVRVRVREKVIEWLRTQAKGMPMLYRVCATSRLTLRARQQKTTRCKRQEVG